MSGKDKFVLTYLDSVNILPLDFGKPDGASAILLTTLFFYATVLIATGKKKRSIDSELEPNLQNQQQLIFKVLIELDIEDCLALAVCYEASTHPENRTEGQNRLLLLAGDKLDNPMRWSDYDNSEAKYQYAGYIGRRILGTQNATVCSKVFDKCKFDPKKITDILTKDIDICDNMDVKHSSVLQAKKPNELDNIAE